MNKKGWIASICIFAAAAVFSLLSLFNFQDVDRLMGEYIYLYLILGLSVTLLVLTIFLKKNNIFLLIPVVLLFIAGYYFDYLVLLNASDYITVKSAMITSYPTVEFILFIAYITALVFALLKKQKWAVIVVIVYSAIKIFTNVVDPVLLSDLDFVADYLLASMSMIMMYVGIIAYFASMLANKKEEKEEISE